MPDEAFTAAQLASFQGVLDRLEAAGLQPPLVHAANSAAAFRFPAARRGMVRSGIALYGVDPGVFARLGVALRPMLSLRARVVALRTIEPGEAVGYDQRFRAPRRTRVAVVPVGYHDGYSYRLGNRGRILVGGRSAPVIGSVTMDYLMADVTDLPGAAVGDVATLIGRDGEQELSVEELARIVGTIPYELTCRIGPRVPRRFVGGRREPGTAAA
jgi:alanine racemase